MNVTLNKTDSVNATITVDVVKSDYEKEVENSLKDLRRNAIIPGFRKGMVPPAFLFQKYGKSILVEEINKLVSKSLSDYIIDNKLAILGEPLPSEEQAPVDFDKQEDFNFTFDVGLSPVIDVQLTKDDHLTYYTIQVTEDMIDQQIENFKSQYGTHDSVEDIVEKDLVKGHLVELNESGEPKDNGIIEENAILMPAYIKNEDEKKKFLDAKLHTTVVFNPSTAYDGNEAELTSLLKIKKEEVKNYTDDFSFEIYEISRYKEAEINQELFDKVFGPEKVDSEAAFRDKIKEDFAQQLAPESDYKFIVDVQKLLEEKASNMQLPDAFLKRWLLASDPKRTPESVEEDYPKILNDLKFHLIKEHFIEVNEITIEENDLLEYAKQATHAQFAQYGMYNIPDDLLERYAQDMLKKKETYRSLGDKAFEDKLIKIWKDQVTLEPKEISVEEYKELLKQE
jgi:trigger factor